MISKIPDYTIKARKMIDLEYEIIDLHTHLRDNIPFHTKLAKDAGIGMVLYMANTNPCLDNVAAIKKSLKRKIGCLVQSC